jgi:hypothetical protein
MARPSHASPKLFAFASSVVGLLFLSNLAYAATPLLAAAKRGPGGYLSLLKIGLIAIVFFIWVRLADWINRDTVRIGDLSGLRPEIWNPLNVVIFLAGFFAAITIPIFWAGYPLYLLCAFLPWLIYRIVRRSSV